MSTVAILTIKRFDAAKQRLGGARFRPALAEAMMTDVVTTLHDCETIDEVLIVSGEPKAHRHGNVIDDPDEGHNQAAARGIEAALLHGATRVLLAAGDCPLVDSAEIDALLLGQNDDVVVIADRHGTGTNGLILSPPEILAPSFGEGSCARHQALAAEARISVSVASNTSMALDIDTPGDLEELIGSIEGDIAPHTRDVLRAEGLL